MPPFPNEYGNKTLRYAAYTAFAGMILLLAGSCVWYRERILFADCAYKMYDIIHSRQYSVSENRWGCIITQVLPLAALKMHLPLRWVIILFSINFNLFYAIISAVLTFWFRTYRLAVLMAAFYFLFVSASFFWPNNELNQANAWMFLFWGILLWGHNRLHMAIYLPLLAITAWLAIFTHLVCLIPFSFIAVFLAATPGQLPLQRRQYIPLLSILVAIIVWRITLSSSENTYDAAHLKGLRTLSPQSVAAAVSTPVVHSFLQRCWESYWVCILIFAGSIFIAVRQRCWQALALTLAGTAGYLLLMGIIYYDLDANTLLFHIESEWTSLAIIIGMPAIYLLLPRVRPSYAIAAIAGILAIRCGQILQRKESFTKHTELIAAATRQMKKRQISKLEILSDETLRKDLMLTWAVAEESILLSGMEKERTTLTCSVIDHEDPGTRTVTTDAGAVRLAFGNDSPRSLNNEYFNFDSTRVYRVMSFSELMNDK